jgi:hypothetical protein
VTSGADDPLIRGWCYYDLGRPEEAAALLGTAVAGMTADAVRTRALFGVRLSLAHAAAGNVEMACALADEAVEEARQVASATVGHQLRHLERLLTRWRRRSCVQHVQARITATLPPPA